MSAYGDDPRVEKVGDYHYVVTADDTYDVSCWTSVTNWSIRPSLDSRAMRQANLYSRDETEGWLQATTRGGFSSVDEAIYALIGDPA